VRLPRERHARTVSDSTRASRGRTVCAVVVLCDGPKMCPCGHHEAITTMQDSACRRLAALYGTASRLPHAVSRTCGSVPSSGDELSSLRVAKVAAWPGRGNHKELTKCSRSTIATCYGGTWTMSERREAQGHDFISRRDLAASGVDSAKRRLRGWKACRWAHGSQDEGAVDVTVPGVLDRAPSLSSRMRATGRCASVADPHEILKLKTRS